MPKKLDDVKFDSAALDFLESGNLEDAGATVREIALDALLAIDPDLESPNLRPGLAWFWRNPEYRLHVQAHLDLNRWTNQRRATLEKLLQAEPGTPGSSPRLVRVKDLDTTPPAWLWYPLIPCDALTLVVGQPSTGKTTLAAWLAARISKGDILPNFSGHPAPVVKNQPARVVWYDSESTSGAFRRRLEAAGADLDMVDYGAPDRDVTLDGVDAIRADLLGLPTTPVMVVFDTLGGFLTGKTALESMADMRRLLRPLAALAAEIGAAFLLLHHEGKARRADVMHTGVGSIGIMGAARSALFCGKHPDPEEEGTYVMVHSKSSEEATAQPVAYRLERHELDNGAATVKVELAGVADVQPLDVVNGPLPESDSDRGRQREITEWVEATLADGPVESKELKRMADGDGLTWRAVREALTQSPLRELVTSGKKDTQNGTPYRNRPWVYELSITCQGDSQRQVMASNETRVDTSDELLAITCQEKGYGETPASNETPCKHPPGYRHNGVCMLKGCGATTVFSEIG